MEGRDLREPLYFMTEVREMTRSELILDMAEISFSVMPSEKYSSAGSPE